MKKIAVLFVTFVLLFSMMPVNAASNTKYKSTRRPVAVTQLVKVKQPVAETVKTVQPTKETVTTVQPTAETVTTVKPTTEPVSTVQPIEQPVAQPTNSVSVLDFGAKGDGTTDDTAAIQKAIDSASTSGAVLVFPASTGTYRINSTLILKDNTSISGKGATLFMPSQDSPKVMLKSTENSYIKNVTIEGLSLKSNNDRNGSDYLVDSLTSNVLGIYILGIDTLTIKDVRMDDMYNGLKLGASLNGVDNYNVKINNLQIINSSTPLLMGATNGFTMTDSILDAGAGNSHWLHSAYIDWGNTNLLFENTKFINSPGSGVNVGAGDESKKAPTAIKFENCSIENSNRGFNIYDSSVVTVSNTSIKKCNLAFSLSNASNVTIDNVNISEAKTDVANSNIASDKGAFAISNTSNTTITNVTVDANGMGGSLFELMNKTDNITISNMNAKNMDDIGFFYNNSLSNNFIVEKSNFEWTNISNPRLSFRGSGANATFRNNTFINKGNLYLAIADNYAGTSIKLENNSYSGFKSLSYSEDYSVTQNNLNLDNNTYDANKNV